MKQLSKAILLAIIFLNAGAALAQEDKSKRKSPPAQAQGKIGEATVTINYSQPSVKNRTIWGELVPYDKVWRTGANEATTFETSKDLMVQGRALKAGKYSLFTIPSKEGWVVIFNSEANQWGAYKYDKGKDVLRVDVTAEKKKDMTEMMTFVIKDDKVHLQWEYMNVMFNLSAK